MSSKLILIVLCVLSAAYDYLITRKRMNQYGKAVELSGFAKSIGAGLSIFGVMSLWCVGLGVLPTSIPLAVYTGMRLKLALLQYTSLATEKKYPELFKKLFS